jgi:Rrf2 family protein
MKLSAQEEYGLRCLLQVARRWPDAMITIPGVAQREGLSVPHAAKVMQMLRQGGFVRSVRGQVGGYTLARPPDQILVGDVLSAMGGRLYEEAFCRSHKGSLRLCRHTTDCSIRSLWRSIQGAVDRLLASMTLQDLLEGEDKAESRLSDLVRLESNDSEKLPARSAP